MMTAWAVLGGFVLDAIFGDPAWLPHPVVYMGKAISRLEKFLRARLPKTPQGELLGGAVLAFCLPVGTLLFTGLVCWGAAMLHPLLGLAVQMFWCGQALAAKGLVQESTNVYAELKKGSLPAARKAVSRIVGRDTEALTAEGVTRAAVETVAENASDGVIAPLLYMLLGGAPLALTYKAINTMDSMLGYKNEKYLYFGRAAAKLDEQLQYDAMKKRIKYMYETGNTSLLQIIFSSESMGDFLNKAEFVKNITEYDRNMLDELQKVHELVAKKDSDLKAEQASLAEMKTNLDQQEQELNDKISSTSGELQASSEALAKAKEAQAAAAAALKKKQEEEAAEQQRQAEAAQTAANNTSSSSGNTDSGSSGGNTTITVPNTPAETTDLVLFAAILQCEAGGYNYDGILAVATVIMNRVESPLYPNTISGVVYQSGQFAPTWDGSLSRVLQRGPVSLCYQVAQEALGGSRLASVSGCYQFRSASTGMSGINVGGNVFF